ncbi:hypothetical protein KX729_17230 [Rhizobium sp. XQZ8]|uniref:hypothetical protein n=1 Tax=Rhizobium populisoli TaxID=2859785 RepID=UPI001CA51A03|nr:hypothetical protein [Rhizobium populisoli]MBW6423203.1 hypothetical protein [Rhizobium populisoli]
MLALLAVFIPSLALVGLIAAFWRMSRAYQNHYSEECLADDMEPVVRAPIVQPAIVRAKRRARKSPVRLEGGLKGYAAA